MNELPLDGVYEKIINKCCMLIKNKNINIVDVANKLELSNNTIDKIFKKEAKDFTLYLKLYDTLVEW